MRSLFGTDTLLWTSCLLLSSLSPVLTGYVRYRPIRRSCGVEKASEELRQTHKWLRNNEPLDNDLWNSSMIEQRIAPSTNDGSHSIDRRQAASPVYTIDTYFHIVADSTSASPSSPNYISDDMVSAQFNYLTQAYAGYSIGYRLMGIDRSTNNIWAANGDDYAMKSTLRRGTYSSLNIYYQSQLQATANTPGITPGDTLLGFCSLPSAGVTATTPVDDYVVDGCNILSGTMPGGNYGGYNLGGTTVHEVGHWNGLLHTFNGGTCNVADFGDYVADTPQEAISTSGCPAFKDSCRTSGAPAGYIGGPGQGVNPYTAQGYSGVDPIHNFMDYSTDACYAGFTPGQAARMVNIWRLYRQGL